MANIQYKNPKSIKRREMKANENFTEFLHLEVTRNRQQGATQKLSKLLKMGNSFSNHGLK